ncbi:unnamed protein product [Bursaphelenchus okinawaensis]|uniref:Vacuolar ATPase assembly integral membrane protein VMA21 homolog n=1 Tax=Bursaphelenchus okinawaensis TaxID=465554 RepID=A0A811KDZ4_9BILA|nr:unnamed protein product [Bursaphelenchus okinawaensis]CAG9102925.1 unnamed protein product [Bursaphelenchus okinawaensis]
MGDMVQHFRDPNVQSAVKNLMIYSLTILAVPLGSMFFLKKFLFEAALGYSNDTSMTYSAIIAVILVHVVLIFWLVDACKDDRPKKLEKKD